MFGISRDSIRNQSVESFARMTGILWACAERSLRGMELARRMGEDDVLGKEIC